MEPDVGGQTIGQRIATRRVLSGRSVRQLAAEAGIAHTTWGRIERGERGADNRVILGDIARVLNCTVADLTGRPGEPTTRAEAALAGSVHGLLAALVETNLDDEPTVAPVPLHVLAREAELLDDLRVRADYAGAAARLGPFTRQLHATTVLASDPVEYEAALKLTVLGASRAGGILRDVGQRAEAYLAGERAQQAAEELGDPVMLAAAFRTRAAAAMGCGGFARAHKLAVRGLGSVEGDLDVFGATETAGHLHLLAAMTLYGLRRGGEGDTHLEEAERLAVRTGDSDVLRLYFGPTNLRFWRLAIAVDTGDAEEAVRIVRGTNPAAIGSVDRQSMFYLDAARACARLGHRDADRAAIRMLAASERIAPQRARSHPFAAETMRVIVRRTRRSDMDGPLRALAVRLGVTA
ncbi:transcriptional regulator [Actinorhabdospora filicis]|uniref:Transcriptional regulator n=1 Tax=Actinorhabdospora filicis TaxID=1785913 RepID=A0A9W6SMF4_9ACTN|nr:helix-turn-helix transcriptional regulator [Actinorhabdospora filicis]GLZ78489.1 transcriptional regulator [Actinorhabdospora filicis]